MFTPETLEEAARREAMQANIEKALAVFRRHGYTAGDLDYLLYEGQAGTPGDDDPDLEEALSILGTLREAGFVVR
jgi:hypothetical protein